MTEPMTMTRPTMLSMTCDFSKVARAVFPLRSRGRRGNARTIAGHTRRAGEVFGPLCASEARRPRATTAVGRSGRAPELSPRTGHARTSMVRAGRMPSVRPARGTGALGLRAVRGVALAGLGVVAWGTARARTSEDAPAAPVAAPPPAISRVGNDVPGVETQPDFEASARTLHDRIASRV